MMKLKLGKLFISGALLATSTLLSATTLVKMEFDDMVKAASACVVGETIDVKYINDQGGMATLTTFRVTQTAFGNVGETITVRTAGGVRQSTKISTTEVVAGAPKFFENTESLLLLNENDGTNDYNIVGFSQGVFPVVDSIVSLPQNVGNNLSVDSAISIMSARRNAATTFGLPQ